MRSGPSACGRQAQWGLKPNSRLQDSVEVSQKHWPTFGAVLEYIYGVPFIDYSVARQMMRPGSLMGGKSAGYRVSGQPVHERLSHGKHRGHAGIAES